MKKSKIRKILDKHTNTPYFNGYILKKDFAKLEKELQELVDDKVKITEGDGWGFGDTLSYKSVKSRSEDELENESQEKLNKFMSERGCNECGQIIPYDMCDEDREKIFIKGYKKWKGRERK